MKKRICLLMSLCCLSMQQWTNTQARYLTNVNNGVSARVAGVDIACQGVGYKHLYIDPYTSQQERSYRVNVYGKSDVALKYRIDLDLSQLRINDELSSVLPEGLSYIIPKSIGTIEPNQYCNFEHVIEFVCDSTVFNKYYEIENIRVVVSFEQIES